MKTSIRLLTGLTAFVAAVSISTLAGGAAAMAAPSLPPITTFTTPQVSVTVNPASVVLVGSNVTVSTTANWSDGTVLAGTISLDVTGPAGTTHLADFPASTAHTAETFVFPVTSPGDFSYRAHYSPPTGTFGASASGSTVAHARVNGVPSVALQLGKAVAGSPTRVTTSLSLPATGAAFTLGGIVNLQVDALGTLASCTPVRVGSTGASCTTSLPTSLTVGTHAITAIFSQSPTYLTGTYASTFTVSAAPQAPKAGTSSSSSGASGATGTTTVPTPGASQSATPVTTPTAIAVPGQGSDHGNGTLLPATTTASTIPLWIGIAIAILLVALVAVGVLVTVAVVRSRRARLRPSSTTA